MLMPDKTISHYRILEEIGRGGMGIVYKAEDVRLGRFVAIKFLTDEWEREEEALKRFRQEARAASSLNHPNICTVYDIDQHDGRPFIVMEYLEGATLERRLATSQLRMNHLLELGAPLPDVIPGDLLEVDASGQQHFERLSPTEALRVGAQIADALEAAHAAGIIHRNVKPGNVFLTNRKEVKLLDFGLAKLAPRSLSYPGGRDEMSTHLTGEGVRLGTVAYMSPEQLEGVAVDSRTDLFSLGTVLYEMMAQRHPFLGKSAGSTIANILKEEPRRLADLVQDATAGVFKKLQRRGINPPRYLLEIY
jgi:serine/threonine protein kinase